MIKNQASDLNRRITASKWLRPGLIAGAVIVAVVVTCLVAWAAFGSVGRYGADTQTSSGHLLGERPPAEDAVQVVEVEKLVAEEAIEAPLAPVAYDAADVANATEQLIIRNGSMSMIVEDTRAARTTIEQMVARMAGEGAFVVSSNEYGGSKETQPYISMSIRIPAAHFEETMDRLAELAVTVTSRDQSSQDVTEEYVDLAARLESLEAARQRLLDIMAEARTTKDLLEAEQQLTQRESEIESMQGRMQYLEQSARLSSIWIELQPYILSQPVGEQWRPAETVRRAVETLVDGLRSFGDFLIFFAIAVLPWLLAIGLGVFLVVWFIRWRTRVRRARRSAAGQTPGGEAGAM